MKLQAHECRLTELTGLLNRRGYAAKLSLGITAAREKGEDLSLLVLDVDRFKNLNDSYGHATGHLILTQSTRDRDIPCRFGGEAFAVILPGIPPAEARFIAERLRQNVLKQSRSPLKTGNE